MSSSPRLFRDALIAVHESAIDPLKELDPAERRRQAEDALRRHMRELGKRSGESRRRQRALRKAAAPLIDALLRSVA